MTVLFCWNWGAFGESMGGMLHLRCFWYIVGVVVGVCVGCSVKSRGSLGNKWFTGNTWRVGWQDLGSLVAYFWDGWFLPSEGLRIIGILKTNSFRPTRGP